jgi:hypothetical protein
LRTTPTNRRGKEKLMKYRLKQNKEGKHGWDLLIYALTGYTYVVIYLCIVIYIKSE